MNTHLSTKIYNFLVSAEEEHITVLYQHLFSAVNWVPIYELTWKVPLGSQVIVDDSDIVKKLSKQLRENFMRLAQNMVPTTFLIFIRKKCNKFVRDFASCDSNKLPQVFLHDERCVSVRALLAQIGENVQKDVLILLEQKIKDDAVKIWYEINDRMYWVYKGQRSEKDEFGIVRLQVAGSML
ncbi:hypothetical protein C1645_733331 [Glomus cerebriforme]|uniref:Uncharacterized protein n=1 Tax=Glomus cerebriforme TaxID=658196 RepID=A0A397TDU9_9GLOM|nr:hypothetical protein C1645_733331 [Glomus cerebriforme]